MEGGMTRRRKEGREGGRKKGKKEERKRGKEGRRKEGKKEGRKEGRKKRSLYHSLAYSKPLLYNRHSINAY
jgi:hypothetical protein